MFNSYNGISPFALKGGMADEGGDLKSLNEVGISLSIPLFLLIS